MANLITIDEYKSYKDINSEADDSIISLLIGSVSDFIKTYTDRTFIDYAYTDKIEYFDALSYGVYYPNEFPLLSVTEIATSTDGGVTWTILVENTDYFISLESEGGDNSIINNTVYSGFGPGTIPFKSGRITYKAGYIKTPADVKLATMDLVHYYRKESYTSAQSLQGASVTNPVTIIQGNQLPRHIKRVLDNYRVL